MNRGSVERTRLVLVLAVVALIAASLGAGCATSPSIAPPVTSPVTAAPVSPSAVLVEVDVYFTDSARYAGAVPPYEVAVKRTVPSEPSLAARILEEFFRGPTPEERSRGLEAVTSGATGIRSVRIVEGVAHVFLVGTCRSNGATYTVADGIRANLLPLLEVAWVKIYDETGETEQPFGQADSIPFCLEP